MNTFELSRNFFGWAFENPEKIKPHHAALYFFAVNQCNYYGWSDKFQFPTGPAMSAIGMKRYHSYKLVLEELEEFGFIKIIERSKNQYTSNIIQIVNYEPKTKKSLQKMSNNEGECFVQFEQSNVQSNGEAMYKATAKQCTKQRQSSVQSNVSIIKLNNLRTLQLKNFKTKKRQIQKNKQKETNGKNGINLNGTNPAKRELRIYSHNPDVMKNMFLSETQAIFNGQYSEIIISGGTHIMKIGNTKVFLTKYHGILERWIGRENIMPRIAILFALFCDIMGGDVYSYVEDENSPNLPILFEKFKNQFSELLNQTKSNPENDN